MRPPWFIIGRTAKPSTRRRPVNSALGGRVRDATSPGFQPQVQGRSAHRLGTHPSACIRVKQAFSLAGTDHMALRARHFLPVLHQARVAKRWRPMPACCSAWLASKRPQYRHRQVPSDVFANSASRRRAAPRSQPGSPSRRLLGRCLCQHRHASARLFSLASRPQCTTHSCRQQQWAAPRHLACTAAARNTAA